ncbi:MAG: hypothetical protein PHQ41_06525, partial [Candidatus Cloacimonetes bacterium]|nr:hypothetical protein [Candidatus Cloacimonadota bacterium]
YIVGGIPSNNLGETYDIARRKLVDTGSRDQQDAFLLYKIRGKQIGEKDQAKKWEYAAGA